MLPGAPFLFYRNSENDKTHAWFAFTDSLMWRWRSASQVPTGEAPGHELGLC